MKKVVSSMYGMVRLTLMAVLALGGVHCGGPTSSKEEPVLAASPEVLDFEETRNSLTLTISNTGTGSFNWSITVPSEGWIELNRYDGTVVNRPMEVDVRIDREKAPSGQHEIRLVVTGAGTTKEITLRATIRREAVFSLSPSDLDYGETSSQQQVTVRNDGGETLTWSAASVQNWISIAPGSGSLDQDDQQAITITIDRQGLASGSNQGTVDFTSNGGSASVRILAEGTGGGELSISPNTLDFGSRKNRESVELRNIGDEALDWTAEVSDAWIDPKTTTGSLLIGEDQTIFIEVSREDLDPNAYQGNLTFRWEGGATELTIAMRVADEPLLSLSDESLDIGSDESFTFSIINAGSGNLNWEISETAEWLELDPVEGTTATIPRTITGTVDRAGMAAGDYDINIRIESDGGSQDLPLLIEVPAPSVEIVQGPEEGTVLGVDQATFQFRAINAAGQIEFSTRLDDEEWTGWSEETEIGYENLEESSLVGSHLFQVRVRADAGEAEALIRTFEVDAVQGPALRLSPKVTTTTSGQTVEIDIIAEEVENVLAARVLLEFDADELELQQVETIDDFLGQHGGSLVAPDPEIDNAGGRLDLSIGVAGGSRAGVDGTGVLARLRFRTRKSGVARITLAPDTALRDPDNHPISIKTAGTTITVQ